MPKNKSKGARTRVNRPAKPFRSGIVVVHGVGNQKRGATVEHVAGRIDATLHEVGITAEMVGEATGTAGAGEPRARQITFGDAQSVLIAEA